MGSSARLPEQAGPHDGAVQHDQVPRGSLAGCWLTGDAYGLRIASWGAVRATASRGRQDVVPSLASVMGAIAALSLLSPPVPSPPPREFCVTLSALPPVPQRPPVEARWFGLERRTVAPTLAVLAVAVLLLYGLPALNSAIPWNNQTRAGDVLDLGRGATAVPPVGWQLEGGSLVGGEPAGEDALLARGSTLIQLRVVAFDGTAAAFFDQVEQSRGPDPARTDGPRTTLTSNAGLVGVVQNSTSPSDDGLQATFKLAAGPVEAVTAAPALLVEVVSAPGQFEQDRQAATDLLRSVTGVTR